jgi:iron complex transport system substrate-binding protein
MAGGVLTGCGSETAGTPAGGRSAGGRFPATVNHQFGATKVEKAPERVVSLGWGDADALLALGVVPVGVLDWFQAWKTGVGPWAQDRLKGTTPQVLKGPDVNVEAVAALRADLVAFTKSDNVKATWEKLSKLGPAVSGPANTPAYGTSWTDQVTLLAQALGRPEDGTSAVAATTKAIADAKAANPAFAGKTVCVAAAFNGQYGAYVKTDGRVQFLEALGFTNSPKIEALKPDGFFAQVAKEQAGLLNADLTVVFALGAGEDVRRDTVLNATPAAKAGRLLILDEADLVNAFSTNSVLSIPYTIEKFVPMVTKALG